VEDGAGKTETRRQELLPDGVGKGANAGPRNLGATVVEQQDDEAFESPGDVAGKTNFAASLVGKAPVLPVGELLPGPCAPEQWFCTEGGRPSWCLADGAGFLAFEPCDDGDICDGLEYCSGGTCLPGNALKCSDANACTTDSCDPVKGCQRVNNNGACDDGVACTKNACIDGSCQTIQSGCECQVRSDCAVAPTKLDKCLNYDCKAYRCVYWETLCGESGDACTLLVCNPKSGKCQEDFAILDSAGCDDGDACTVGDRCTAGACTGKQPTDCDDNNTCTVDTCHATTGCIHMGLPVGSTADDFNACTGNDVCIPPPPGKTLPVPQGVAKKCPAFQYCRPFTGLCTECEPFDEEHAECQSE